MYKYIDICSGIGGCSIAADSYGGPGEWYRVASEGTVEEVRQKSMLITIDRIDGDSNATVIVKKKYIHALDN